MFPCLEVALSVVRLGFLLTIPFAIDCKEAKESSHTASIMIHPLAVLLPLGLLASAIPQNSSLASTNADFTCFPKHSWRSHPLIEMECRRAIAALLVGVDPAQREQRKLFRDGDPDDPNNLPKTEVDNRCDVVVDLSFSGRREFGTWLDITARANLLSETCVRPPGDVWGGTVSAGVHGGLKITLQKPRGAGDDGDDTAVGTS